jgi:lysophospholipase L1-like esterase
MKKRIGQDSRNATGHDSSSVGGAVPGSAKNLPRWKRIVFSLLPVSILLVAAEAVVRLKGLAEPRLKTLGLLEEKAGIIGPDPDLFWSLRPNLDSSYDGARVTSNALGLRSPEVRPKEKNELRILSLGESSTFGVGVSDDQTYTALLAHLLQDKFPSRHFTAFNAGVSAWSSFQSLKYLELRGLRLAPDIVLFYHELNDYLPSTLRDSSSTEIGAMKTDQQLYDSRVQTFARSMLHSSALFRYMQSRYAHRAIQKFNQDDFNNPLLTIGLPNIGLGPRLGKPEGEKWQRASFNEKSLGQRVSEDERNNNLRALAELCRFNDILLIIIHPAYLDSREHTCLLTRFCGDNDVPMYEAYKALHPPGTRRYDDMFHDGWHPNAEGHRRLAEGLAEFIERIVTSDK